MYSNHRTGISAIAPWRFKYACSFILSLSLVVTFSINAHANELSSSEEFNTGNHSIVWVKDLSVKNPETYRSLSVTPKSINRILQQYLQQFPHQNLVEKKAYALTVDDIHGAADALTLFYRQAGLIFHRAIVPPQEITSGYVELEILSSNLSSVSVIGNKHYDKYKIVESFRSLLNRPVEKDKISNALARTNELPGLQVFGYFSAGRQQGDTHVNLKVLEETRWISTVQLDNYGVDSTGEFRITADMKWVSPLGIGDIFHIGAVQTTQPTNNTYGFLQYRIPFFKDISTLYFGYSNNQFELGESFEALLIEGESRNANIGFDQRLWQSGNHLWQLSLQHETHESELTSEFDAELDAKLTLQRSSVGSRYRYKGKKIRTGIAAQYRSLSDDVEENYQTLSFNAAWYCRCFGLESIRVKARAQDSEELLPSTDRLSLGGNQAVRAVEAGYLSVDSGSLFSLEPHFPIARNTDWYLFYDLGRGEKLSSETPLEYEFAAAGMGLRINFQKSWQVGVTIGKVLAAEQKFENATSELSIVDDMTYLAQLRYQLKK